MARTISVEIIGDASSLQKSFQKASNGAKGFERDLNKSARGAVAASVSFRGLGRSIAFASSFFLGSAGIVYGLKSAITQAESLDKAQRSLAVAVRKSGGNFQAQLPTVNAWANAQQRFGISVTEAEQGLARATVITGSASKGMRAYTEALEISKATGKSFTSVLLAAAKANEGQTTALARYIGKIPKGTSALKLFTDVQKKYAGQAAANTTATDRLHASFANIETTVGLELLPTVEKYAGKLADWLSKSKNQERVQRDVNRVVKDASAVIRTLATAVKDASHAVGGFKNLLEIIIGLKVFAWARSAAIGLGLVGGAATTATAEATGLRGALLALNSVSFGPLLAALGGVIYLFQQIKADSAQTRVVGKETGSTSKTVVEKNGQYYEITRTAGRGGSAGRIRRLTPSQASALTGTSTGVPNADALAKARAGRARSRPGSVAPTRPSNTPGAVHDPRPPTLQGQLNLADLAIAEAAATKGTKDDIAALTRKAAVLRALIDKGGTLAQQTQRNQELASTLSQINSLEQKSTKDTTAKRKKQVDLLKKEREAEKKAAEARKQALQQALDQAKSVIGDLGQGPVATGDLAQTIQSFGGKLSASMYTQDLAAQNKNTSGFLRNLHRLAKRGAPSGLIQTLLGQGQGGMDEAAALAGASPKQLALFLADYKKRQKLITQVARMEVHTPYVTVNAKNVQVGRTDAHDRPGDPFSSRATKRGHR